VLATAVGAAEGAAAAVVLGIAVGLWLAAAALGVALAAALGVAEGAWLAAALGIEAGALAVAVGASLAAALGFALGVSLGAPFGCDSMCKVRAASPVVADGARAIERSATATAATATRVPPPMSA
jgi:hypothetical protein